MILATARNIRFRRALYRHAHGIIHDASYADLRRDHPLFKYSINGETLIHVSPCVTAQSWLAHLAFLSDMNSDTLRLEYWPEVSIKLSLDSGNYELIEPPVTVYIAMLRDVVSAYNLLRRHEVRLRIEFMNAKREFCLHLDMNSALNIRKLKQLCL